MVPVSAFSVVVFFLFVVPGTCYELLRSRALLPVEESAFVQVSRILASGTLFTTVAIALLVVIRWSFPNALLDPSQLLAKGTPYVAANVRLVTKTVGVQLLLACLLAAIAADLRVLSKSVRIHRGTALLGMAEVERPLSAQSYLCVHLKGGKEILGYYYGATTDLDSAKRELILQPPLKIAEPVEGKGDQEFRLAPAHWQRMIIPGSEIEYTYLAYVDTYVVKTVEPGKLRNVGVWVSKNYLRTIVCGPAALALLIGASFHW